MKSFEEYWKGLLFGTEGVDKDTAEQIYGHGIIAARKDEGHFKDKYKTLLVLNKKMLKEVSEINIKKRKIAGLKDDEHLISGNFNLNGLHSDIYGIVQSNAAKRLMK